MTPAEFKEKLKTLYEAHAASLAGNEFLSSLRKKAFEAFYTAGFPTTKNEEWRFTNLAPILSNDYNCYFENTEGDVDVESFFRCDIMDLDTYTAVLHNGWFVYKTAPITKLRNGVIIGSLQKAFEEYPELIKKHFGKYCDIENNAFEALNTAFASDGVFIYVPDNVIPDKPIQIINIINKKESIFIQPRNLVIVGKNSKLSLVLCDDALSHMPSLNNSVTEIFVDEHASVDHYKMQNNDNLSAMVNNLSFHQLDNSVVSSNTVTLNGGFIRNNITVSINGEHCESSLNGLYLVDGKQHIDNHTFIDHIKPNSTSSELFKGIIDNQGKAVFNGSIIVRKDAQKTAAFQTNRNILLNDEATINTKPNLQIYADDVKCSHGATVGQLDTDALFYLRSRGISEDSARMLMMNAFAEEVAAKIAIEPLRERVCHMIEKRIKGELSICDQCVLHCKKNEPLVFNIDMSKI
jgi:Fe-S cluster assembly protein SufD